MEIMFEKVLALERFYQLIQNHKNLRPSHLPISIPVPVVFVSSVQESFGGRTFYIQIFSH